MNFGDITRRMVTNCGNLQSSHPQYANINQIANDALRFMILRASNRFPNLQVFPEHKDVEWDDITVADINYLTLPSDALAIQRVFSTDSASPPDYSSISLRPLAPMTTSDFDQLPKPTTQGAYPTNWMQREGRLYLWATPRVGYTTYIKADGFEDEPTMSSATATPRTHARWHPAWLDCASHLLWDAIGDESEARRYLGSADEKLSGIGQSMVGLRSAKLKRVVRIAGMPNGYF